MRKHTRLYAIVLTAFYLVGIMAAAAAAAAPTLSANPESVTATVGEDDVEVTISRSSGSGEVTFASSNTSKFTIDKTSYSFSSSNSSVTITVHPVAAGTDLSITVTNATGLTSIPVTINAGSGGSQTTEAIQPVLGGTPTQIEWGNVWSFTATDSSHSDGTWSVVSGANILEAAGLEFDAATQTILNSEGLEEPWKPQAAVWDAIYNAINGTTGARWNGAQMTAKIKLKKVDENAENADEGTKGVAVKEYTLTFKKVDITLAGDTAATGTYNQDIDDITITATGPGTISWDVDAINKALPTGLTAEQEFASATFTNTLTIAGAPQKTYKNYDVTLTASNTGSNTGAKTHKIRFNVTSGGTITVTLANENGTLRDDAEVAEVLPGATGTAQTEGDTSANTAGNSKVGDEFTTIYLRAVPGPVTWKETNLTATGLKFEQSGDEYVKISGKFDTARADTKPETSTYTLTATSTNETTKVDVNGSVMVWEKPAFDNTYIFHNTADKKDKDVKIWKADFFKTNEVLEQAIPVSNLPEAMSWDVSIKEGDVTTPVLTFGQNDDDEIVAQPGEFYVTDTSGTASASYLSAKVKDGVLYLIGSTDRAPKGGKITVSVKAENYAGDTTKDYPVMIVGTTPALAKKNDMTLNGYGKGNSADIAITAGDPTITMTAKIEAKTAKKIFGIEKDIDLLADGPKYGIYVSGDMANGQLKIFLPDSGDNNGTDETQAHIESLVGNGETDMVYKGYAFKKLPIVITAKNPDITYDAKGKAITDKKIATQKATLSTSNNTVAPYWVAPEAEELYKYGLSTALVSQDLGKKQVIYVPQKKALADGDDNPYYFDLVGYGPFDVVVKPTEKNGIKVAITDAVIYTDENGENIDPYTRKRVTFTGTPSDTTKDVATAFSLTAKNPSTGKSAKLSVNFTALPTPKVQEAKIGNSKEKPATVGKKVKVAPKITSNSKKIGWKIESVEWNGTKIESDTVSQDLYDIWGLALDKKGKGSIEGTATAATGTTNPLTVVMHAYTKASDESEEELTTSDPVTATIYIAGEKPKLGTKKVTVTIDDTTGAYNFDDSVFEIKKLNNSSATTTTADGDNPEITALGENKNRNHYVADMEPTETFSATAPAENTIAGNFDSDTKVVAAKGLSIVRAYSDLTAADSKYNTFKLDGTPAGATKKETVQIAMNNWGTIQTDKLTVTIVGQTPVVEASTESLTDLPETSSSAQKITFTVSNTDKVGSKIKWKITSKPSSGVKAKLVTDKSKPTQATVEITTKKATAGAETSVTVSATDSDTKKAGTAKVALTVKAAAETKTEDTPTVVDDTKAVEETKTEEKALGEGEVHFGRERTAAGLTAAQRKFLADNGYVIAAVLPEIEVTEAGGQYALEVDELEEAAATGAELVYFAFSNKPTDDDEIVTFADLETGEETTVLPASRKLIVEPWFNVGTKYAPVIAVKAAAGEAEAATEEDVKAKAEEKAEEAAAEGTEAAPEVELKEVKDKDAE